MTRGSSEDPHHSPRLRCEPRPRLRSSRGARRSPCRSISRLLRHSLRRSAERGDDRLPLGPRTATGTRAARLAARRPLGSIRAMYSALYQELPWLAEQSGSAPSTDAAHDVWKSYIGPPPKAVSEVGSGTGALAHYLAENGYRVRASEITRYRGGRHRTSEAPGVTWGETDGVHPRAGRVRGRDVVREWLIRT